MRKLAGFSCGFAGAVFFCIYLLPVPARLPLAAGCAAVCVIGICLRRFPLCAWLRWIFAGLAVAFLWCSVYDGWIAAPAKEIAGQTVRATAEVTAWPRRTEYGISVETKLTAEQGERWKTLLYLDAAYSDLKPGDQITAVVKLNDAGIVAGEFSDLYYSQGIRLTGQCYGQIEVEKGQNAVLRYFPQYLSHAVQGGISAAFPDDTAPMIFALVTGDKDGLPDSFYQALQRTGLAHTVAVSGMHLTFLAGMLAALLKRGRRLAICSIGVIVLFTLMVGATPSVVRAAIMQILLLLAPAFNRENDRVTSISFALACILAANPYAVANVGLQLSFGSVVGIQIVGLPLNQWLMRKGNVMCDTGKVGWIVSIRKKLVRFVCSTFSVSIGAMLFTAPLTAWQFGTVSLLSPLSNLIALPLVEISFVLGLVGSVIALLVPPLGMLIGLPAVWCVRLLQTVVPALADTVPYATVRIAGPFLVAWLLLAYSLLMLNLLWRGRGKRRPLLSAAAAAVSFAAVIGLNGAAFQSGDMTVSAIDVGQGQSVLIRMGEQWTLVDCGGNEQENAGDLAADYLESLGRHRLDYLVLTHYHEDHANGIPQLLDRISVETIFLPDVEPEAPLRKEIIQIAETKQVEICFVQTDTQLELVGGGTLKIYPPLGQEEDINELGLSVLASAGDFDTLVTGDMGSEVEQLLLQHTVLPDIELMVVGHHGSRYSTSEELLEATRPEQAIISVGRNSYGHPTQEVLDRLEQAGAEVYRTDLQGTVTVYASADAA